jgi:6-pyruvoyltetrahydropterin/6-carboxytetrahydropterin synthase
MKFSSAHFTILESTLERLHGHNYQLLLHVKAQRLRTGVLVDFGVIKEEARRLCAQLDEAFLVPARNRELKIAQSEGEIELRCRGKRYVLPESDCRLLPLENISCECLAEWFCRTLMEQLRLPLRHAGVVSLAAVVQESPGQSGRCEEALASV